MPLELQIIRAAEFIRAGPKKHFDLAASKAALADLAGACRKRGINQALLDLRSLQFGPKPVFSPADLTILVNTFHEIGFTMEHRLAILYSADPHRRARLFAFLSSMHGWNVQAFGDFEHAISWLSSGDEPVESGRRPSAQKLITVQQMGQEPAPRPVRLVGHKPHPAAHNRNAALKPVRHQAR